MKKVSSILLILLLLVSAPVSAAPKGQSSQAFDNKMVKRIKEDNIYGHVSYMSEVIGSRPAGSEAELETVDYLVEQFESYGYDEVKVYEFTFTSRGNEIM